MIELICSIIFITNGEDSLNYENYGISYINITVRPENKNKITIGYFV